jgi:hypothetical protein
LRPLDTAATNRSIVPALGDYDDGEIGGMIGRGNRGTRGNLPQCRFVQHKPHMITVCYNNLKKYSVLLSLLFNHFYMYRLYFLLL